MMQPVEVQERPAPVFELIPPTSEEETVLDFQASATGGIAPLLFEWDFGDGNGATGEAVQHTYTAPGLYDVVLTVTANDGNGCPETITTQVEILPSRPPDPILNLRLETLPWIARLMASGLPESSLQQAEACARRAVAARPSREHRLILAKVLAEAGSPQEAREVLQAALAQGERFPRDRVLEPQLRALQSDL